MNCVSPPARDRAWRRALLTAATVLLSLVTAVAQNDALDDMVRTEQRYTRDTTTQSAVKSLRDTDAALTNALRSGQSEAYRGHLAEGARLHRPDVMPLVGEQAVVAWLTGQPRYAAGESKFADTSMAGDLGYTYGTYAMDGTQASHGFYVRVWSRGRDGVWRVALDVLQPV